MPRTFLLTLLLLMAAPAAAQHHGHHGPSPYTADTARAVKALAPSEVTGYLEGQGMGFARAAELNSYPGPKHVLDLADDLSLTPEQRATAERLAAEVQAEARPLGARLVEQERHLDALFASGEATAERVDTMTAHIAETLGQLRAVHLRAHVAMRAALTPEQIATYDRLRGYTD